MSVVINHQIINRSWFMVHGFHDSCFMVYA